MSAIHSLNEVLAPTRLDARRENGQTVILLVDDDVHVRRAVRAVLAHAVACSELSVDVIEASDYDKAMSVTHSLRRSIDLLISDIRLGPGRSGLDLAHEMSLSQRSVVESYFQNHCSVLSKVGVKQLLLMQSVAVWQSSDENVGQYKELRLRLFAPARAGFDPRDFILAYDAVIHQVPNHFALVEITQDFRTGLLRAEDGTSVGVIRFDFRHNTTPPISVKAAPGNVWRGFQSVIALGFRHVTTGIDHVLFLLTLLVVAPLAVAGGGWTLFQGWSSRFTAFLPSARLSPWVTR